jgi:hypothetical protein
MAINPLNANLDQSQIFNKVFDPANDALRVEGILLNGAVEVAIDASTDNIAIKDFTSGNVLKINADGSINVDVALIPPTAGASISQYSEVNGVALGATVTVLTYTVPTGKTLELTRVEFSGDCIAEFDLELNTVVNDRKRLHWTSFNNSFNYLNSQNGYSLVAGTVIAILATNKSPRNVASFNATLQGVLE